MHRQIIILTLCLIPFISSKAQTSKGIELYREGNYQSALVLFNEIINDTPQQEMESVELYRAISALQLNSSFADIYVEGFLSKYRSSPKSDLLKLHYSSYLLKNGDISESVALINEIDLNNISTQELPQYYFLKGYANLNSNNNSEAKSSFSKVDSSSEYYSSSLYYLAHIDYLDKNYNSSKERFQQLLDDDFEERDVIPYYLASIAFAQGEFAKAASMAIPLTESSQYPQKATEMQKVAGEALYMQKRYEEALPFLTKYHASDLEKDAASHYIYGYILHSRGEYAQATSHLSRAADSSGDLSQNSSYYLADCYLKTDKKREALAAFKSAYTKGSDAVITEDALFNYAKLSYETSWSPFNESLKAFEEYVSRYPDSERSAVAYQYLGDVFKSTHNYQLAISLLEKISQKSRALNEAYQRALYYRGVEAYNNDNSSSAYDLFLRASNCPYRYRDFYNKALFWMGDIQYKSGNYQEAISLISRYLKIGDRESEEYYIALYNRAYSSFNIGNYASANSDFAEVISTNRLPNNYQADALNRLGDCFFSTREFTNAIAVYTKSQNIGAHEPDYSLYMRALCAGLSRDFQQKIATLETLPRIYPNSDYNDNALFESGISWERLLNNDKAVAIYNRVINEFPNSNLIPRALLQLGLIEYNADKNSASIDYFKRVITDYPNSEYITSAKSGLKNNYIDINRVDDYFTFLERANISSGGESEQDSLLYIAAEKLYMHQDKSSESALEEYLARFPDGAYNTYANFYLSDLLLKGEKESEALIRVEHVIEAGPSLFYTQALVIGSDLAFNEGDIESAKEYYTTLTQVTDEPTERVAAELGLLNCAVFNSNSNDIITIAEKIIGSSIATEEQKRGANYYLAQAYKITGRENQAYNIYKTLSAETTTVEGAEAKYIIIEKLYQDGDLDGCETEIDSFIESNTPHHYWLAKSFITLAHCYEKRDDLFQAKHTLKSLQENYTITTDGILTEVNALISKYQQQENNN